MWEIGRSWSLLSPEYPEALRRVEQHYPWLWDRPDDPHAFQAVQAALADAERSLPPPPREWGYPRLVLAEPPAGRFPGGLWHQVIWRTPPKPMRPLTGFRRVLQAVREDLRAGDMAFPRTRGVLLKVAPRIGLLDPFRQVGTGRNGEENLLPDLPGQRVHFGGVGLGEDLWTWVRAALVVGFWDLAAQKSRERMRLEVFVVLLPEMFGVREGRWRAAWEEATPSFADVPEGAEVLYIVAPTSPESVLLREVHHLARKGTRNGVLSPSRVRARVWEWGLKGLVVPGPFRFGAAPEEGVKVGPLPALGSSFHLALLEIAGTLGERRPLACEWCGATFTPERPGRARFCSDACRLQAHRARKRGFLPPPSPEPE